MRKIIFRGKTKCTNQWIYGCLTNIDTYQINCESVFKYSVGQFTGITDKNGIKVFEADVVKHKFRRVWSEQEHTSIVVWNDNFMCYYLFDGASNIRMREDVIYEVIGNAYDNSELVNK